MVDTILDDRASNGTLPVAHADALQALRGIRGNR
jgi:hypothetical protein